MWYIGLVRVFVRVFFYVFFPLRAGLALPFSPFAPYGSKVSSAAAPALKTLGFSMCFSSLTFTSIIAIIIVHSNVPSSYISGSTSSRSKEPSCPPTLSKQPNTPTRPKPTFSTGRETWTPYSASTQTNSSTWSGTDCWLQPSSKDS